jgi:ABC-type multidrug transport system ATPase subunit
MIELEEVTKAYGPAPGRARTVVALEEVTFRVPPGATWAVVGPNGAGKTTLFALALGFLHPTTGRVRLAGLAPRAYLRRHGAAFLPERFQLPGEWTVDAALLALARLERLRGATARARVDQALERFGLAAHAARPIATLSRGLLQRVGLAQTLLSDGRIVVLDEPTEGLDPIWRIQFRELIDELRRDGRTILIASHDLAEVERVAEQAVLLEDGRIREILPVQRQARAARRYRIELARPAPAIAEIFPGATAEPGGPSESGSTVEPGATSTTYLVEIDDNADLSTRLAALLATGATLVAAAPVTEPLEERVQQALSGGAS